ncbi:MAG: hypothetical protein ACXWHG_15400 [Thermoanaerobaculia bacterium]
MNKFLNRTEGQKQIVTLLTGKLTYQEAHTLAQQIKAGQAPPIEWMSPSGKSLAKQLGDLKVIRPMPVRCDDKSSGVVMVAMFVSVSKPTRTMHLKLSPTLTVQFEEQ